MVRNVKPSNFSENRMIILNVWNLAWQVWPANTSCWKRSIVQCAASLGVMTYVNGYSLGPLDSVEVCLR